MQWQLGRGKENLSHKGRDILTASLGNPEHPGRVRGISSKEGWKDGFEP
jgi:hypothetical protein